jgi:hypothetical protein
VEREEAIIGYRILKLTAIVDKLRAGVLLSPIEDDPLLAAFQRHARSNPQGREARRPAGHAIHQVRVRHQPADGPCLKMLRAGLT